MSCAKVFMIGRVFHHGRQALCCGLVHFIDPLYSIRHWCPSRQPVSAQGIKCLILTTCCYEANISVAGASCYVGNRTLLTHRRQTALLPSICKYLGFTISSRKLHVHIYLGLLTLI